MSEPLMRHGARAVVLDPADRILLVRFQFPDDSLWATPGGGLDEGETHEQAVVRELAEEVGLTDFELGPCIWLRENPFELGGGRYDGQIERYFLVRTDAFEPEPHFTTEELESEYVTGHRWWTLDELRASDERFAPTRLPELVAALLSDGPPPEAVDVGV